MIELKCAQQQLYCCDAMLKHDTFILTPDSDNAQWRLYSVAKYQDLQQKLQAVLCQLAAESHDRLTRITLGNGIELQRQGMWIPLPESLTKQEEVLRVVWIAD